MLGGSARTLMCTCRFDPKTASDHGCITALLLRTVGIGGIAIQGPVFVTPSNFFTIRVRLLLSFRKIVTLGMRVLPGH